MSTAKDFETLKKELEKLLGEDWQVEDPKKPTEADEAGRKALGLSEDARVNYINPKNPKVKVALSLTKRPGLKAGEVRMFLTIVRDPKK
ncbi:MAG: hypothetical protein P1U90_15870 [Akkermansiaceae bacterium]|nr:hypothetical protein [Akkermansiaceae bacterium]